VNEGNVMIDDKKIVLTVPPGRSLNFIFCAY